MSDFKNMFEAVANGEIEKHRWYDPAVNFIMLALARILFRDEMK